jgi:hypothetical protein
MWKVFSLYLGCFAGVFIINPAVAAEQLIYIKLLRGSVNHILEQPDKKPPIIRTYKFDRNLNYFPIPRLGSSRLVISEDSKLEVKCTELIVKPKEVRKNALPELVESLDLCRPSATGKGDSFDDYDKSKACDIQVYEGKNEYRIPVKTYIISPRFSILRENSPVIRWINVVGYRHYQILLFRDGDLIEAVKVYESNVNTIQLSKYVASQVKFPFRTRIDSNSEYRIFVLPDGNISEINPIDSKKQKIIADIENISPVFRLIESVNYQYILDAESRKSGDPYIDSFDLIITYSQLGLYSDAIDLLESLAKIKYDDESSVQGYLNYFYNKVGLFTIAEKFPSNFPAYANGQPEKSDVAESRGKLCFGIKAR